MDCHILSAGPADSYPFERIEESRPSTTGNTDDFSWTGLSNGQVIAAQRPGYGQNMLNGPYATSYGFMSSSELRSYDCMGMATGPSVSDLQSGSEHPALQSLESAAAPYAPQFHDANGASLISGSASDPGRWYNTIYPLFTSDPTESVPGPLNAQPRVIKKVIATECVMHWFPAVSGYIHQEPQSEE
ncbi:hypothetical protein Moror_3945 [Moniliophthora roreri MCA 2997]|uniref:Uncharacterized protein n=1 Tax=Moniliophthora roreri (strain MCA 2997) TaxID=1381753 RepID=V2XR13_MONRO|nr:hypothetical protein Moror_3945 [Moniliophthora roreri MCA 2997]